MKNVLEHDQRLYVGYRPQYTTATARKNAESPQVSPHVPAAPKTPEAVAARKGFTRNS